MTTGTITPYRSEALAGHDGFAQLLHAEWTKFRTVRGWLIGLVVAALATVLLGLLTATSVSLACHSAGGQVRTGRACVPSLPVGPGGEVVTDSFYFVHKPLTGDGSVTVRLTSLTGRYGGGEGRPVGQGPQSWHPGLEPWTKAGIIIKASTKPGSAYAAVMVTGSHGVRMQYDYTHDTAGAPGGVSAASPRWLRLTRANDFVTGYESADGVHWTELGAARLAGLPATVQTGLFVASPLHTSASQNFGGSDGMTLPSMATAVFGDLSLSGSSPDGAWTGGGIDANSAVSPYVGGGFHQAGGVFTVTGSGDIAPAPAGADALGHPNATIGGFLAGTFAGLIAITVVATLFVTAEYRRGLIRTTLAASPRRGRVLAAKAVVAATAAFVTGLVAAAVAVVFGPPMARDGGMYVFPATAATDVRVVVGTAALLAAAAVLAVGLGAVLRRSTVAVTAVIVAIVLPYILAMARVLPVGAADWLLRLTPAAAFAIQQSSTQYPQVTALYTPTNGYFPLAPWAGFAVLCGYAAVVMVLAAHLLRRRDA